MWQLTLTREQRDELATLRRDPTLKPAERDRVEMVALSVGGQSVAEIAAHLGRNPETVRRVFRRFASEGWQVVRLEAPGPERDLQRRETVSRALRALLGQARTWTARQAAAALAEQGITLSTRQTRRYLSDLGATYRRTKRSVSHKQDPVRVAQAREELELFKNERRRAS